ncbi:hypothetical protein [Aquipseudomonas alcaligenes]|uniref:Uncharacterized protein n=1 Tax=Aquipseudomonas alcaligenes (strain ATCC 14909 / DSM 50342 / CCUG 1425 / JCM 20561 / NBRC 14159 / NCIMB 9945 / NCTC 10367 / 1577) TaxID=1215092 RepID=U3B701_AQUA1|nr:hypothetical protein [Pseudomonas alcaligenes]GAD62673.1 hypothetical protein PA6_014_00460 [Pseudomonas alcaligenes NBRC 14159]SUD18242.1 Uncharacterised protein [Pseudomonas alcaligenes]
MSPAIQLLLIQIMQLGAMLAANPRYQVFTYASGHIQQIEVLIYPAGAVWRESHPRPKPIARAMAYWEGYCTPLDPQEMHAAEQTRLQRELEFMRAALHAYLPADHTDITDLPEAA